MDCKKVQEKLLDYIDGELDKNEEIEIKKHIERCKVCNGEYDKMKSTINYLRDKGSNIHTNREMNLNPNMYKRKPIRNITRTGLIAVILSIVMVVSVFATDLFGFIDKWKESSQRSISAWEKLIENGVGQKLDISVIDKDIKVTAEGIIADELNTVILLKIEDLKGNNRLVPPWEDEIPDAISIGGDIESIFKNKEARVPSNYRYLYAESENTVGIMIKANHMDKKDGNVEIYLNKLVSLINKDEESILTVDGNWDLTIPAKKLESKTYKVDEHIDLDGNKLIIEKIIIAPTATRIEYKIEVDNEEEEYLNSNVSFSIKSGLKTYGRSELSSRFGWEKRRLGFAHRRFDIESLYLEDPKQIGLIINRYEYITLGKEKYSIDWDNLPQVIEYRGSEITIEDIQYKEDRTEILIKEDDNKNREYMYSNIYIKTNYTQHISEGEYRNSSKVESSSFANFLDWQSKDSKGKIIDKKLGLDEDEIYQFVTRQKLIIEEEDDRPGIDIEYPVDYLIPDEIYIQGQSFTKFPNIRKTIKLK